MTIEELQQQIISKQNEIKDLEEKLNLTTEENKKIKTDLEKVNNELAKSREINTNLINKYVTPSFENETPKEETFSFEDEVTTIFKGEKLQ